MTRQAPGIALKLGRDLARVLEPVSPPIETGKNGKQRRQALRSADRVFSDNFPPSGAVLFTARRCRGAAQKTKAFCGEEGVSNGRFAPVNEVAVLAVVENVAQIEVIVKHSVWYAQVLHFADSVEKHSLEF